MAYRKKARFLLTHKPDLVIVPECEHPAKFVFDNDTSKPTDVLWFGSNLNKGLGVFSYGDYRIRMLDEHDAAIKTILPISVTGPVNFMLFAVWAYNADDPRYNYIGQVWKAILLYANIISNGNVILMGDFNSNLIWDKLKRKVTHAMVVEKLESLNIFSVYHRYNNKAHGIEAHPTYFLYRHQNKPYHIDYCFASIDLLGQLQNVAIGTHAEWAQYSDHSPLIVTFKE